MPRDLQRQRRLWLTILEAPADKEERQRWEGEIAEARAMFGGSWGRLAARGEGSGGGDGGVTLV